VSRRPSRARVEQEREETEGLSRELGWEERGEAREGNVCAVHMAVCVFFVCVSIVCAYQSYVCVFGFACARCR
jgi:hypothetical protein